MNRRFAQPDDLMKNHSIFTTDVSSISTNSLPLRHSSKPKSPVYSSLDAPASHCQIESLPLTARHQQDLRNPEYHLLYDLIGSRFYASCPELIANEEEEKNEFKSPPRALTFYKVKSRSSWRVQAPERRPQSRISKIIRKIPSYLSACIGTPSCFREE
jgi:hypothetical protein